MTGTLHVVHVGKTGGSAIAGALVRAGFAKWNGGRPDRTTPCGRIRLHAHGTSLTEVPPGDHVMFAVRDPIARFVSAFYSRQRKGQPRYFFEWTARERMIFERFATPQELAASLSSEDEADRRLAEWSLLNIRHLNYMERSAGTRSQLRARLDRIAYIARQETLDADWAKLRVILGLPDDVELPAAPDRAHRRDPELGTELKPEHEAALRRFYARDYRLLAYCERLRALRGWGPPRPAAARVRGLPAMLPPPPLAVRRRLRFL